MIFSFAFSRSSLGQPPFASAQTAVVPSDGGWPLFLRQLYKVAACYKSYAGNFGRVAAVYGPYGGAGGWAAYNPRIGTYARGGAVYGPYNFSASN